eukprot:CAMPEP_0174346374 /NCGR_PEP_ID=MMETSP0811_2-20130205/2066_1 /TAXON_ID=73025 ORGANISM="Eutreptiella gymnastica-like, Strain CCMP1594" /NCGR_SAMPLE_ID=MMETSP0811_2 /ASSEMBLY_ACC=CAM_ASM_000667 /LENGTH=65 /DNA_ID=CAMNT_0015470887 /DNA_START=870 /DNA_END=1063 /DNA_ORIENTATION=+
MRLSALSEYPVVASLSQQQTRCACSAGAFCTPPWSPPTTFPIHFTRSLGSREDFGLTTQPAFSKS